MLSFIAMLVEDSPSDLPEQGSLCLKDRELLKKKGSVEMGSTPHQMSAVIPDQYNLPKVKDAKTSKKTFRTQHQMKL